jgi:phosphatidylglycerophosphate synthase
MLSRWVRTWDSSLLRPLLLMLTRAGLTPNMLTVISLALFIGAAIVVAQGALLAAGGLLLLGGLADGIDGELARVSGAVTPFGSFLDSICDHSGDFALSLGLLWLYLSQHNEVAVILIFVALFGSMLGSQVRSRAGMVGINTKDVGLVTRFERTLLLMIGIFTGHVPSALWVLAVLNNVAALQRMFYVVKRAHEHQSVEES